MKIASNFITGTLMYWAIKIALPEHTPEQRVALALCIFGIMLCNRIATK